MSYIIAAQHTKVGNALEWPYSELEYNFSADILNFPYYAVNMLQKESIYHVLTIYLNKCIQINTISDCHIRCIAVKVILMF